MNWINYCACALTVGVSGYKLLRVRRDRRASGLRYLSAFFFFLGLGLATMAQPTLILASHFEPVPNLARLVGNGLEMTAAYFLGALGQSIARPQHTRQWLRRHGIILAAAIALMATLLLLADTQHTLNFVNVYSRDPLVVGYLAVFFLYIAASLATFIHSVGGYVRHIEATALRVGLRFAVAGAALGIIWAGWSGVRPMITLTTGRSLATTLPVGSAIGAICVVLWLIGATLTAWGNRLTAPLRWGRAVLRYRQIQPLWRTLHEAVPQVTLTTTPRLATGAEFALYRRVIEIRDAQLVLRPYAHPEVARWVGPAADPATLEAAVIAAALAGHAAGRNYGAEHPVQDIDPSLAAESAWLARVAWRFHHAPEVQRVRQLAAAEAQETAERPGPVRGELAGD
ncbi:MAB_1171c family putative transporter [Micromonospora sp. NPDC003197]